MIQILDDLREVFLRLFVKVRDSDTGCQDSVIRMFCGEVCGSL
jgi:hypothetical protein